MKEKKKKICFVASAGGHWEELMCLKEIANKNEAVYITEKGEQHHSVDANKTYLFTKINRKEKLFIFHFLWIVLRALLILLKENPDVVISTGALLSYPFCMIAKLFGKKVIYIESFARVNSASLTGKLLYPHVDLFIVQWETMLEVYPKAVYAGWIF